MEPNSAWRQGAQRWVAATALALGVLLVLPSLRAGFFSDDYLQIAQLEGWSESPAGPLDLYSFVPRDSAVVERMRDTGVLPYFAAPGLEIAFWRPLSSALMALDHTLRTPRPGLPPRFPVVVRGHAGGGGVAAPGGARWDSCANCQNDSCCCSATCWLARRLTSGCSMRACGRR